MSSNGRRSGCAPVLANAAVSSCASILLGVRTFSVFHQQRTFVHLSKSCQRTVIAEVPKSIPRNSWYSPFAYYKRDGAQPAWRIRHGKAIRFLPSNLCCRVPERRGLITHDQDEFTMQFSVRPAGTVGMCIAVNANKLSDCWRIRKNVWVLRCPISPTCSQCALLRCEAAIYMVVDDANREFDPSPCRPKHRESGFGCAVGWDP